MTLRNKTLESIQESDLQSLVDNCVLEGKTIEYKESLPSNSDKDKKEFLADVSSFANTSGGDLVFGIKEKDGVPMELGGLECTNIDAEKQRLENIIRDGIEESIPNISIREVSLKTRGRVAIIIRIPRSWASPHFVAYKGHFRCYSRTSAGKYPLDVSELRRLFALSETTAEKIRNFRAERLSKIVAGETPVALYDDPKTVLHIIPLTAFDPSARFDVSSLARDIGPLRPIYTRNYDYRHNLDGLLTYGYFSRSISRMLRDGIVSNHFTAHSYLQIFRNGIIEAVDAYLLSGGGKVIPSVAYEKELLEAFPRFLSIQKQLGVELPLFVMLSLLGVAGYTMAVDRSRFVKPIDYPIDRDDLLIPEVMVESFECDPVEAMRPIFDAVWNAAGWPRSMNYDETGKWVGR